MKIFTHIRCIAIITIAFLASNPSAQAEELDTTVDILVKQTQADANGQFENGTISYKSYEDIDILADDIGDTFEAGLAIGPYGSLFELFLTPIGEDSMSEEPYATKFVSAFYTPRATAELAITSADTSPGYTRTREDEPFAVTISGLANDQWIAIKDDEDTPEITWDPFEVKATRFYTAVDELNVDVQTTELEITSPTEGKLNVETSTSSSLSFNNAFKVIQPQAGRSYETFTIEGVINQYEGENVYVDIASETIKIWPTAKGEILNEFDQPLRGNKITKALPKVSFNVWHLYPKSDTFIVIYKLKDEFKYLAGTDNKTVAQIAILDNLDNYDKTKTFTQADDDYVLSLDTVYPQGAESTPREIILFIWDELIPEDGIYSVAVYTKTPFEASIETAEHIAHAYIEVDRTIEIKGSVITSE